MATRVLLARHGDTAASQGNRFATVDIPLTKEGRVHASELAVRLARYPIDAIYASSLHRAMDTAGYTARVHGMEVTPVPNLREIDHGVWASMSREEIMAKFGAAQIEEYEIRPRSVSLLSRRWLAWRRCAQARGSRDARHYSQARQSDCVCRRTQDDKSFVDLSFPRNRSDVVSRKTGAAPGVPEHAIVS